MYPTTTRIYTLSLHDALPIFDRVGERLGLRQHVGRIDHPALHQVDEVRDVLAMRRVARLDGEVLRSEEHTSELQSQSNLVCRLLLEKKNTKCPYLEACLVVDH